MPTTTRGRKRANTDPYKSKVKDTYIQDVERDAKDFEAITAMGGHDEPEVPTLPAPPALPEEPEEFEPVELALGDRVFLIGPISKRGGAQAYDDSADFAVEAMPMISRLFSLAIHGQADVRASVEKPSEVIVAEMVQNLGEQDMLGLVREMRSRLPYLAMLACRGADPDITEDQIKELAGSPLNPELLAIVFTQIMADRLLETMLGLGAGFGFK
jgi:hypothetical protein